MCPRNRQQQQQQQQHLQHTQHMQQQHMGVRGWLDVFRVFAPKDKGILDEDVVGVGGGSANWFNWAINQFVAIYIDITEIN